MVDHFLSQLVALYFVVVAHLGVKAEVLHRLAPRGAMASTFAASSEEGKEVGILMKEGNSDPVWLGHENMAEGNGLPTVYGETRGHGHPSPFKMRDVTHGMGLTRLEQKLLRKGFDV